MVVAANVCGGGCTCVRGGGAFLTTWSEQRRPYFTYYSNLVRAEAVADVLAQLVERQHALDEHLHLVVEAEGQLREELHLAGLGSLGLGLG